MRAASLLVPSLFLLCVPGSFAQLTSMLGEQDFPDNVEAPNFAAAQVGELPPAGVYQSQGGADILIEWNHVVSPLGNGTLTVSLWDLDPIISGNQVESLTVNGFALDTAPFDIPADSIFVRIHNVAVPQGALGDGNVSVSMRIDGRTANMGVDFVGLTVLPEPSLCTFLLGATLGVLRRSAKRPLRRF